MKNDATHQDLLAQLERTLDAYGADSARWPEGRKTGLAPLIAASPDAQAMVREAAALDRLLMRDRAEAENVPSVALMSRILAAARTDDMSQEPRSPAGEVIALPHRAAPAARRAAEKGGFGVADGWKAWPAVGMLAASLLLGVYIGSSGSLNAAVASFTDVASYSVARESTTLRLPGVDTEDSAGDELL